MQTVYFLNQEELSINAVAWDLQRLAKWKQKSFGDSDDLLWTWSWWQQYWIYSELSLQFHAKYLYKESHADSK